MGAEEPLAWYFVGDTSCGYSVAGCKHCLWQVLLGGLGNVAVSGRQIIEKQVAGLRLQQSV